VDPVSAAVTLVGLIATLKDLPHRKRPSAQPFHSACELEDSCMREQGTHHLSIEVRKAPVQ
jgi:hypothetical protein